MILIILIILPIIGAVFSFFLKERNAWFVGILSSVAVILTSILAYRQTNEGYLNYSAEWIQSIGAGFDLSLNAINYLMCLLTGIVFLIVFIFLGNKSQKASSHFYGLMLLSMAGLLGVFLAYDALLFYVFWELALIPVYFLCSMYGGEHKVRASFKFFIYTFVGSLIMLAAIIYIHTQTNNNSFSWQAFVATGGMLPEKTQHILFWMFFVAFAIKMPIFPFHTWQPDTYQYSYTPVTVILSAVMVKMGLFAVMNWLMPVLPLGCLKWMDMVIIFSLIGVVYASCMALVQKNIKRLIAYSSVAHIGLMCAALFSFNNIGTQGVIMQMFNHGINILGLWLLVHVIESRTGTQNMEDLGGLGKVAPVFTLMLVILSLANVALPLTNSFPAEFMMFTGIFNGEGAYPIVYTIIAGLGIILSALYMLNMVQKVAYGSIQDKHVHFEDLTWNERFVFIIILLLIFVVGFYPNSILHLINTMAS